MNERRNRETHYWSSTRSEAPKAGSGGGDGGNAAKRARSEQAQRQLTPSKVVFDTRRIVDIPQTRVLTGVIKAFSDASLPLHESDIVALASDVGRAAPVRSDRFLERLKQQVNGELMSRKCKLISVARSSESIVGNCELFISAREAEEQRHITLFKAPMPGNRTQRLAPRACR